MTTEGKGAGAATSEPGAGAGAGAGAGKGEEGKGAAAAAGAGAGAGAGADGKGEGAGAGGGKGEEGKGGKGDEGAGAKKAPEKYTLTLPAGGRLAAGDLTRLEATARANDWTNDEAQAYLGNVDSELQEQSDRWAEETRADKDLGGEKLEATQQLTQKGIDFLFPKGDAHREGFLEFLNRGGAGNNIHVVRALARIGKQQREDGSIGGAGGGGQGPQAPEDVLYKSTPSS